VGDSRSPTSVQRTRASERQLHVLARRADGASLPEIARELGMHVGGVYKSLQRALESRAAEITERTAIVRALEAERLEKAAEAIWPRVKEGDARAQDTWLRNRQRYAALLGLDLKPPDVTVDASQNVIVLPAWGEQAPVVEGEATETGLPSGITPPDASSARTTG
jgi:DNA-binding CsgD family transcriptional regulator